MSRINPIRNLPLSLIQNVIKNSNSLNEVLRTLGLDGTGSNRRVLKDIIKTEEISTNHFASRTSVIWCVEKETLEELVGNAICFSDVLKELGFKNGGNCIKALKTRLALENIDISHFKGWKTGRNIRKGAIPLEEVLVKNSNYPRHLLKKRLIDEGVFQYTCDDCGINGEWNGKPITLQLHHKNGNNKDNTRGNLCFLCPNCHSQTENFSGKNSKKIVYKKTKNCKACTKEISIHTSSSLCTSCSKVLLRKVSRPSKEELEVLIRTTPFIRIAEQFGVSDNAVRKWCDFYGLPFKRKDIEEYFKQLTT